MITEADRYFMKQALAEAQKAFCEEEVPVGAVIVCDGETVGLGHNTKEQTQDPTGHAEMVAIRTAAKRLGRWRLSGCTLYVTLEPCPMCVGAMLSARLDRVVFGCTDPKAGAVISLVKLADDSRFNHRLEIMSGVLATESRELLQRFFRSRRG